MTWFVRGEDPKAMGPVTVPAPALLSTDGGREKIIGFVARGRGAGKAAGAHELRQDLELFAQLGIEVTPTLVISERVVPIGRSLERVPPNKNGPWAFVFVEAQKKFANPTIAPAPLSPRRRIVFGSAW